MLNRYDFLLILLLPQTPLPQPPPPLPPPAPLLLSLLLAKLYFKLVSSYAALILFLYTTTHYFWCKFALLLQKLYLCEFCLSFFKHKRHLVRHLGKCAKRHPPGVEMYRKDKVCMYEVGVQHSRWYRFYLFFVISCMCLVTANYKIVKSKDGLNSIFFKKERYD